MVKYRLHGPKHPDVTDGKIYDLTPDGDEFWFLDDDGDERFTTLPESSHCERFELVPEGPIRTVMRREIVPGTYDGVVVGGVASGPDSDVPGGPPRVVVPVTLSGYKDADQLERAAAVLTALADALKASEAPR